jgi:hypothetical protein
MTYTQVLEYYGSAIKAAKALGIDRKAVHAWKRAGIPVLRQYQIQVLTRGALCAELLSPLGSGPTPPVER